MLIYAERSMGNGKVDGISEVMFVKPETFNKLRTKEIAAEMDMPYQTLIKECLKKFVALKKGRELSQQVAV